MSNQKHKFETWLKGNIKAIKANFSTEDFAKIRLKQEELFQQAVNERFDELQEEFEKNSSASLVPDKFLSEALEYYETLFKGEKNHFVTTDELGRVIIDKERVKIREIFDLRVGAGKPNIALIEYADINKSLKQHPNFKDVVETEALYKQFVYLKSLESQNPKSNLKDILTTKQQILLIHYLLRHGIIDLEKIHLDKSGEVRFIHALINRDKDNVYKYLREVGTEKWKWKYFTLTNLNKIRELFVDTQQDVIVQEIDDEIETIKKSKI